MPNDWSNEIALVLSLYRISVLGLCNLVLCLCSVFPWRVFIFSTSLGRLRRKGDIFFAVFSPSVCVLLFELSTLSSSVCLRELSCLAIELCAWSSEILLYFLLRLLPSFNRFSTDDLIWLISGFSDSLEDKDYSIPRSITVHELLKVDKRSLLSISDESTTALFDLTEP